jgi:hypothetical protein
MAGGLQLRHILSMMGVAGFMQLASITELPPMLRHRLGTGARGGLSDISDVSIPNHDGIDCEDSWVSDTHFRFCR